MKFEEKLMKLRKENALSQEDLAEKLDVTRQTISKWELGQTKPDADKIVELAKLFNVSTDELLSEIEEPIKTNVDAGGNNESKKNTIIIIILVIVLIVLVGGVGISFFNGIHKSEEKKINKLTDAIFGLMDNAEEQINSTEKQMNSNNNNFSKDSYNNKYVHSYTGLKSKFFTQNAIKAVIEDNLNNERKITVTYNDINTKDSKELTNLISKLNNDNYLLSYEYDEDGYINKMIIEDVSINNDEDNSVDTKVKEDRETEDAEQKKRQEEFDRHFNEAQEEYNKTKEIIENMQNKQMNF